MGTSCEIARIRDDGTVDRIHVSYDGYLTGVGLTLFRHYDTPEKVEALFSHQDWATSLEANPEDIDWGDWDENRKKVPFADFAREHAYEGVDEDEKPGDIGLYIHAHGVWSAPRGWTTAQTFIDAGIGDVITRKMLIKAGATDADFTDEPRRPVNEHRGVLSVEMVPGDTQNCILHLTEENGTVHDVFPGPGFTGVRGMPDIEDARELNGLRVVVRSTSIAVTASFGPEGSKSRSAMGVSSIEVVEKAG